MRTDLRRQAIFVLALAGAGCVTPARYKASQNESSAMRKRAQAAETALAEAQKAGQDLQALLKAKADELASLQASNKDLRESLDANKGELSKKVAGLIRERDELSAKAGAKDAEIAALKRQVALAEAARQAVEAEKAAELDRVKKSYEDLTAGLKSEISAGEIQITQLKGKLTVNMVDRILFDSGRAEIKPDGRKILEKVGGILNGVLDKDIRIEGHTDDRPISGELKSKYASNWELSTARATSVARYLEDHASVDPKRLVAAGYGEYRPVASNETPESRALNRRIEIVLVPRD